MGLFKKAGGSFAGTLTELTFDVKEWKDGKKPYHTISAKLVIEKDGAEGPTEQYLPAGFIYPKDGQGVSDDGTVLEGGAQVAEDSEFARFVQSAIDKGIPEADLLDDEGNGTNFQALVGNRYEFGREMNKEKQLASGRKKLGVKAKTASEEEILKAGRQQDKKDKTKFYNHSFLVVSSVLGVAEEAAPATKKTAAPKSAAAKGGKANGAAKSKKDVEADYTEADSVLTDLLADAKNNTIAKTSISSLIVRKALADDMDNDTRDNLRKLIGSDDFLKREAGWSFDGKNISLA